LLGAGLVVGQAVEHRKTKANYKVIGLQGDQVTLALSAQGAAGSGTAGEVKVTRAELLTEWRPVVAAEEEARSRARARRGGKVLQRKR